MTSLSFKVYAEISKFTVAKFSSNQAILYYICSFFIYPKKSSINSDPVLPDRNQNQMRPCQKSTSVKSSMSSGDVLQAALYSVRSVTCIS